jgi:hypothetical protein
MQADARARFHAFKCPERGDIRAHLNTLEQMPQDLENISVTIEPKDYVAAIMQSMPPTYSDFIAHIFCSGSLNRQRCYCG